MTMIHHTQQQHQLSLSISSQSKSNERIKSSDELGRMVRNRLGTGQFDSTTSSVVEMKDTMPMTKMGKGTGHGNYRQEMAGDDNVALDGEVLNSRGW